LACDSNRHAAIRAQSNTQVNQACKSCEEVASDAGERLQLFQPLDLLIGDRR
jgi:hypothetical protein